MHLQRAARAGRSRRTAPRSRASGCSSSENSSTTTNRVGSGSSGAPFSRARSYSVTLARLPAARSFSWRRCISPASASCMRSTRLRSSARLVITAATCGAPASPANVAPPLKSTSTRLSASDECVVIRPSTRVRSSSDLPDPVAPTHSPCGPIPSWAASLMSSSTGSPSAETPNGTRSRSRTGRGRQAAVTSNVSGSPSTPSSSRMPGLVSSGSSSSRAGRRRTAGREPPRERLGLGAAEGVGTAEPLDALLATGPDAALAVRFQDQPEAPARGQRAERVRQVDHGDAGQSLLEHDLLGARDLGVLEHDDHVAGVGGRRGAPGEPAPPGELRGQPRLDRGQRGRHHPHRPGAVRQPRVRDVREPLHPLPLRARRPRRGHRDHEVLGAVERHELREQRPHEPATGRRVAAGDAHRRERAQRHRGGQVRDDRVGAHEAAQGHRRHRLEVVDGTGLRRDERGGEALGAAADAHVREVRVGRAALPHPRAAREADERRGLGVGPLEGAPLVDRRLAGPPAHLREVAQVVLAVLVGLRPALPAAPRRAAGDHADRREREHPAEEPRGGVVDADDDDEPERAEHHEQRQQPQQRGRRHRAGDLRRGLEVDLARRHLRGRRARGAPEDPCAHRSPPILRTHHPALAVRPY